MTFSGISVIIPVLEEREIISGCIHRIYNIRTDVKYEIIVVDGDPAGSTINTLPEYHIKKIISPPGRGVQMNRGASVAEGEILLFLHSDTKIPEKVFDTVYQMFKKKDLGASAFLLKLEPDNLLLRFIAITANLRVLLTGLPSGDQAISIRRDLYNKLGGYPEIPIMEDVRLMKKVKQSGKKICIIKDFAISSSRKWIKEGIIKTSVRNNIIRLLDGVGVSPERLSKIYYKNIEK